jgi:hypothetical protein
MNFQRGREKEHLEINLVPLIDDDGDPDLPHDHHHPLEVHRVVIHPPQADAEKQLERASEITVLSTLWQYVVNCPRSRSSAWSSWRAS